jgi:hypothetical protein
LKQRNESLISPTDVVVGRAAGVVADLAAHVGAIVLWPGALFYVLYDYAFYVLGAPFNVFLSSSCRTC